MRVIVTGAGGFLGGHVVHALKDRGCDIAAIGTKASAARRSVAAFFEFEGVPTQEYLTRIFDSYRPHVVIHLAGCSSTDDVAALYSVNLFYCIRLLAAIRNSAADSRIVIVGSAAEYGPAPDAGRPIRESDPAAPVTGYGESKLAQTRHALSQRDLNVVVARVFNPIGEGMPPTRALGAFVARMADLGPAGGVVATGPLTAIRDVADVRHVAQALVAMGLDDVPASQVYNVCTGVATRMSDLTDALTKLSRAPIAFSPSGTGGGPDWSVGDPSLLARHGIRVPPPDLMTLLHRVLGERA
jgi:nucleoside-diphosphate-sugar epimerase